MHLLCFESHFEYSAFHLYCLRFSHKCAYEVDSCINHFFAAVTNNPKILVAYTNTNFFHVHKPVSCLQLWWALCVLFSLGTIWRKRFFWQRSETQEAKPTHVSIFNTSARMGVCHICSHSTGQSKSRGHSPYPCSGKIYSFHWRREE